MEASDTTTQQPSRKPHRFERYEDFGALRDHLYWDHGIPLNMLNGDDLWNLHAGVHS